MGWLGKIAGGGLGMILGGPLGALFGAALGHHLVDDQGDPYPERMRTGPSLGAEEARQAVFFTAMFAALGKMAKADGRVSEAEIRVVRRLMDEQMGLDPRASRVAVKIFNEAKTNRTPFGAYTRQFAQTFTAEPDMRRTFFEILFAVAMADGELHPAEDRLLREAERDLGLPDGFTDRLRGSGGGGFSSATDLERHYAALGVEPGVSDEELKKAYRKAARDFHPDTIVSKGLPEEFHKFAEQKFKEIQAAYEAITAHRKGNGNR
jgi:DnaJ like chaperone protein